MYKKRIHKVSISYFSTHQSIVIESFNSFLGVEKYVTMGHQKYTLKGNKLWKQIAKFLKIQKDSGLFSKLENN